jgi:hypothetical protein
MHIKNMSFFAFETHIIWREYDLEDSWYTNLANQMQAKLELLKAEKGIDYVEAGDADANVFEEGTPEQLELKAMFTDAFGELGRRHGHNLSFSLSVDSLSRITPMKKFDYKPAHSHSDVDAFAVFYLDVVQGQGGDLLLHDPKFINQITFCSPKTKTIVPVRGTLVAAPAYIWHEVSRYLGEHTRWAIVCNCIVDWESKKDIVSTDRAP